MYFDFRKKLNRAQNKFTFMDSVSLTILNLSKIVSEKEKRFIFNFSYLNICFRHTYQRRN